MTGRTSVSRYVVLLFYLIFAIITIASSLVWNLANLDWFIVILAIFTIGLLIFRFAFIPIPPKEWFDAFKNYVVSFFATFTFMMVILRASVLFLDVRNLVNTLVTANIAVLTILVGVLFVVIQFAAQRYSPRVVARLILTSFDSIFIMGTYLFSITLGLVLVASGSSEYFFILAFISLSFSLLILNVFFLYRLTSLISPYSVLVKIEKDIMKDSLKFIEILTRHYQNDRVQYPRNIPITDDYLIPVLNVIENAMSTNDLATITEGMNSLFQLNEYFFTLDLTSEAAIAIVQYMGLCLTRMSERIPIIGEDDMYHDVLKIQNLLAIRSSQLDFSEAYKWVMITSYYIIKFMEDDVSDYSLRTAIVYMRLFCEEESIYRRTYFEIFLDLLNFLTTKIDVESEFNEPIEKWLMGMESKAEGILNLHKHVCQKIASDESMIKVYLKKLVERLLLIDEFILSRSLIEISEVLFQQLDQRMRNQIVSSVINEVMNDHLDLKDTILEIKNRLIC